MDREFWETRWREGRTAFHQAEANPRLGAHWSELGLPPGAPVWVPLCGKTLDMHWLVERGHPVIGAELSELAIRDFFAEAGQEPEWSGLGAFRVARAGDVTVLCGDVFDLDEPGGEGARALLAEVVAAYDRAALVALPPALRARYAEATARWLPACREVLLLTFEYDQAEMEGPPFSVPRDEVERLYRGAFAVRELARSEPAPAPPRFAEKGMTLFADVATRLSR